MLQDTDSADEIECSSEEDTASPACMQATVASISKRQQQHARVCTETTYPTMQSCSWLEMLLAACCLPASILLYLNPESVTLFCSKSHQTCQTELRNSVPSLLSCSQQLQVGAHTTKPTNCIQAGCYNPIVCILPHIQVSTNCMCLVVNMKRLFLQGVQGNAQAEMQQSASMPKHYASSSRPATAREAVMDLIELANLKIFGNRHFRPQQKEVIKAALQVSCLLIQMHFFRTQQRYAQSALTAEVQC